MGALPATDESESAMPRPEQDPDEHDALHDGDQPREQIVRNGNPGVPQSEYAQTDDELAPPPGPAEQSGADVAPGPGDKG